jgi:hypothetical protein
MKKTTKIKLRQGLFRLWINASIVWIIFIGVISAHIVFGPGLTLVDRWENFWNVLIVMACVPLIVLGIGRGIRWALNGFRPLKD